MDFSRALTFQFQDARWPQKLLLAALLSLIPILGPMVVLGWSLRITRAVFHHEAQELPELDLAEDLVRGVKAWGLNLVYGLPVIVVAFPLSIGMGILLAASDGRTAMIWTLLALCLTGFLVVYSLVLAFVLPAAYARFLAVEEQFSAGLDFRAVIALIRRAPAAYFLVFIGGILCGFISLFGLVACVIGVIVTNTYALTVLGHLYGQAYREAQATL